MRALFACSVLACACASARPGAIERAALLTERGQEGEAARVLEEHLAEHPRSIAERRMLVRVLASTGDLGAARAQAEQLASQLGPASPLPWLELGHALELAHRYDEALAAYDQAATVAPRDPAGPRVGGMRAARWGEAELAEPRLAEATRRGLDDPQVWHALGLVRFRLGDARGAEAAYRAGLRSDSEALENRIGLATLAVDRGDAASALREYDAIIERRPEFADAWLGRSWALIALGRLDEAARAIDDALARGADRRAAQTQLRHLRGLGRKKKPDAAPTAPP